MISKSSLDTEDLINEAVLPTFCFATTGINYILKHIQIEKFKL